jgi:hypothetical protein
MANERLLQGRGLHQILARNEIKAARYLDLVRWNGATSRASRLRNPGDHADQAEAIIQSLPSIPT